MKVLKSRWGRWSSRQRLLAVGLLGSAGVAACSRIVPDHCLKQVGTLPFKELNALAFSPTGDILAIGDTNTVKLWDIRHRRLLRTITAQERMLISLTFSPDGRMIASASESPADAVKMLPDGTSAPDNNLVDVWNVATGQKLPMHTFRQSKGFVLQTAFSPDSQVIATPDGDNTVKLWSVRTGQLLHTLKGHQDFVATVAFALDGKLLASGGSDGTIRLWDVATGRLIRTISNDLTGDVDSRPSQGILSICFGGGGRDLAAVDRRSELKVWDPATGKMKCRQDLKDEADRIEFSRDGNTLSWSTRQHSIMDADIGGVAVNVLQYGGHPHRCSLPREYHSGLSLAVSPDGKMLAVHYSDGITLWTPASNQK